MAKKQKMFEIRENIVGDWDIWNVITNKIVCTYRWKRSAVAHVKILNKI